VHLWSRRCRRRTVISGAAVSGFSNAMVWGMSRVRIRPSVSGCRADGFRSAQRPSVHLSSFKPRQPRRPKEKPPEGCEAWRFQSTSTDCRAWKVSSTRKERLEPLFFAFMGKDATHHRRPYTSRTPRRSTPNAGRNRKHQRSIPRSRWWPEYRQIRHCRHALHRHR